VLTLAPEGSGTRVTARGDAQVGGPIAGVGQRMMEGIGKSMARDFFAAIERILDGAA
jgi:carbon monoxide dehydrogenase subunit G